MNILFLSFYFEPDLCAGSFRNTPLFKEIISRLGEDDYVHVITTLPNRYQSFEANAKLEEIGKGAFYDCDSLEKIVIPDSVKTIYSDDYYYNYESTFGYCDNLKSVVIGNGLTNIDEGTFTRKLILIGKSLILEQKDEQ